MTLTEIIKEGEAMNAPNWTGPRGYRDTWWAEHGPTLLAVAKAAVEVAPQLEGFCVQADTNATPPGGQQAGIDQSWASRVPPSVLTELRWYAREFRRLLDAAANAAGGGRESDG